MSFDFANFMNENDSWNCSESKHVHKFITKEAARKKFKFHKANWDGINSDIQTATQKIKTMYHEDDTAENLWATFKNSLQASIEKNIP